MTKNDDKRQGSMELTGHLGEVMKESAHIAYTVARSVLHERRPDNYFLAKNQIHVHVPEVSSVCRGFLYHSQFHFALLVFINVTFKDPSSNKVFPRLLLESFH